MFPEFKKRSECDEEDIEYDPELHQLTDEKLNEETLQTAVKNIFRKAQDEKLFCVLNGELCQKIILMELHLRDKPYKINNLKLSKFRMNLLKECQECFGQFFKEKSFDSQVASDDMDKEELKKLQEKALIFKL